MLLRRAYADDAEHRPFTARNRYTRALALLRRARTLDPDRRLAAGEARALDALGQHAAAARAQALGTRVPWPAALQARLVEYLEHAGAFDRAGSQARRLAAGAQFAPLAALFLDGEAPVAALHDQEALEALSLGAAPSAAGASDDRAGERRGAVLGESSVEDVGFIPAYRDEGGVTGTNRWCPAWAARRDLVLAGRPGEALDGMPASFLGIPPATTRNARIRPRSGGSPPSRRTRTTMQAAAVARLRAANKRLSAAGARARLYEARQNMWRFGGRGERGARDVVLAWERERPADPDAADRGR